MKTMFKPLAVGGVLALTCLGLAGCSAGAGDEAENDTLVVAMGHEAPYPGEEAVLYAIPKGLGLFEELGIDVTYQPTAGSSVSVQLVNAGEADLGHGNPASVMAAVNQGVDVKIVYNIIPDYGSGLAVLPDSEITAPEDLAGATVGVSSLSSSRLPEAKAMAEEAGVGGEVEFVAVGVGAQATSALASKKVDGLYLWNAAYESIKASGQNLRVIDDVFDDADNLLDFVQFASGDAIENKAESIEKLGKAAAIAQEWAMQHPEEALEFFYEEFPNARSDEAGRTRDLALLKYTLEQFEPGAEGYGHTDEEKVIRTAEFLAEHDLIPEPLDPGQYVDNQFVEAYNDYTQDDVSTAAEQQK
jgi:ABC-type nitrate/sulfonate/bicarbonate transport system substrate-binding protein